MVSPIQTKPFRVFFPSKGGIYEPLIHRYAGFDNGVGVILLPGQPHFIAVYPYAVTGMSLSVEPAKARPGATVRARARLTGSAPAETHLFHFRTVSPDGQDVPGLGQFVAAEKGEAVFDIALPLGLAPGKYSLSARCVVTAAIAGATLDLEP
ncbi:MAG TPA: hypothetical protein P5137_12865 [Candidatus Brocadiia bacterium]|nr:hypothetical protein [Candidatus Brocadiia bacterium]